MAQKRRKTSVTKCEDKYAVKQRREALSAKTDTGKFVGLRAEKPAEPNSAKTAKRWEGFCVWCSICHTPGFRCEETFKLHSEMVLLLHMRLQIF